MHYSKVLIQFAALMIRIGDESDYLVCKPSTNWISCFVIVRNSPGEV